MHKVLIYSSDNLKEWELVSEFGPENAVGGVWECPSLFPLRVDRCGDEEKWVAQIGLNPGGPPGTPGSGTQYFVGDFNGTHFIPDPKSIQQTNWLDWGPDFYAGLTFSGLPQQQRVDIAWMSNWKYGAAIPTDPWRSAMTIPRKLALKTVNNAVSLVQSPVLETGEGITQIWDSVPAGTTKVNLTGKTLDTTLRFTESDSTQFGIILRATADLSEQTSVGYDFTTSQLFVNRTHSGVIDFDDSFSEVYYAPLLSKNGTVSFRVLTDWSSVEVFGSQGEVSITAQIFPGIDADEVHLFSLDGVTKSVELEAHEVESVW